MAEVIAGTAVLGVGGAVSWVNDLWSYNRENWSFDKGQQQNSMHQQQNMRISRYSQFREDMRDLFALTVGKIDTYLTATTLKLGFVISLYYDGRIPMNEQSPNPSPPWLITLYGLALSSAGLYLLLSIYLSINASIQAQSFSARLLTQHLRLPVPTDQDVWQCASRYKEYEASGTQMRIPYVTTAGKRIYDAIKRKFKDDGSANDVEGVGEGGTASQGVPQGVPRIRVRNSRGEEQEVLTHRFMDAEPAKGAALGPPQLVVEDRNGSILPVAKLPHIRMFRNIQENWQPYDAYARVSMLLGTISLCLALCHYATIWYLRHAHQIFFSISMVSAFSTVSVCLLFLEVSYDSLAERVLVCFVLIGSPVVTWLSAFVDSVVLWQTVNKFDPFWSITGGVFAQRVLTPIAFFCHTAFICSYVVSAQPLNLPGFIRNLPHRFRNVRVIDVFAPMNSATKQRVRQLLKMQKPHEWHRHHDDEDTAAACAAPNNSSPAYISEVGQAIELREYIGIKLARLFQDNAARNHKAFAELAARFQKQCTSLTPLIPSNYPISPVMVDVNDDDDSWIIDASYLERYQRELTRLIDNLGAKGVNSRRFEQDVLAKGKKDRPEGPVRHQSILPFSNVGLSEKINKYIGIDTQYDPDDDDSNDEDEWQGPEGAASIEELPKLSRAPWDPPRAYKLFFYCMFVTVILHVSAFIWILYEAITDRVGQQNNLFRDGTVVDVGDNGFLPPARRRLLSTYHVITDTMSDLRPNPASGARLFGCDADDVFFSTYIDYFMIPHAARSVDGVDGPDAAARVGPLCTEDSSTYDALALSDDRSTVFMVFEHIMVQCGSETQPVPILRLRPHTRIVAFGFHEPDRRVIAALDVGGVMLLEKKDQGWVAVSMLWDKANVTSIAVSRDGALQMVSDGRMYDAVLTREAPYRWLRPPMLHHDLHMRRLPVKSTAVCPEGRFAVQTEEYWWSY
eukprot:GEMP01006450.1.p1 GENE.GEMP01006450.1~~GEMP01006450.1.p1  ORF type:complete len:963 (+),score=244.96 GEMP01006450.1:155-3043(+)